MGNAVLPIKVFLFNGANPNTVIAGEVGLSAFTQGKSILSAQQNNRQLFTAKSMQGVNKALGYGSQIGHLGTSKAQE